jgi:anti-sigma B factor antagonist
MRALVSLSKRVRDAGGDVRLTGLNEDLRRLFELTRLDQLFPLYATRADALSAR